MREERSQEASGAATQAGSEVIQDDLRDVGCGPTVSGDLLTGLEAA